jgi:hypothetical protein
VSLPETNTQVYLSADSVMKKNDFFILTPFYRGNLPPFHGNTVILCYKVILPWKSEWNGSKLPLYYNPRKSKVKITVVIYHNIVL